MARLNLVEMAEREVNKLKEIEEKKKKELLEIQTQLKGYQKALDSLKAISSNQGKDIRKAEAKKNKFSSSEAN
ncbi:MAG: hypothetical protein ACETWK_09330 [Candidatus Aminicenantaceae bacterium]